MRTVIQLLVLSLISSAVFLSCSESESLERTKPSADPEDPTVDVPVQEDPTEKPVCGNSLVESGEECDGLVFKSCEDFQFTTGTLLCSKQCEYDFSKCSYATCGNGRVEAGERCDDGLNNGKYGHCKTTCQELGPHCGDGMLQASLEECDTQALHDESCVSQGFGSGTLLCDAQCKFDTSQCIAACTSGTKECLGSEYRECIQGVWKGTLCEGDTPVCTQSGCTKRIICGDGFIDPGESCDSDNLNNKTCKDIDAQIRWEAQGAPVCTDCRLELGSCKEIVECGDNHVSGNEICDGDDLNAKTCTDFDASKSWEPGGVPACAAFQLEQGTCEEAKAVYKEWLFSSEADTQSADIQVVDVKNSKIISGPLWSLGPWGDASEAPFMTRYVQFSLADMTKHKAVYVTVRLKKSSSSGPNKVHLGYLRGDVLLGNSEVITPTTSLKDYGPFIIPGVTYSNLKIRLVGYDSSSATSGTMHINKVTVLYQ